MCTTEVLDSPTPAHTLSPAAGPTRSNSGLLQLTSSVTTTASNLTTASFTHGSAGAHPLPNAHHPASPRHAAAAGHPAQQVRLLPPSSPSLT